MDTAIPSIGLTALVFIGLNFVKHLRARDLNAVVTQAAAWVIGVGAIFIAASADVLSKVVTYSGVSVAELDSASKIIAGLSLASIASAGNEFRKAIDNTESSSTPPLL